MESLACNFLLILYATKNFYRVELDYEFSIHKLMTSLHGFNSYS
jgi:hypothetical protein